MKIYKISNNSDFNALCAKINVHKAGIKIMSEKKELHYFYLDEISFAAINILKQDALSCGAEVLSPNGAILGGKELGEAVLIANQKQIKALAKKEKLQDFKLKELGEFLDISFEGPKVCELMAVLNITDDSFNKASRVSANELVSRAEEHIKNGATWLDIGAASTRPDSVYIGSEAEFARVREAVDLLYASKIYESVKLSIDTYDEKCAKYALDHGFSMLNDISANEDLAALAGRYNASYCLMHGGKKGNSQRLEGKILQILDEFFATKLEACKLKGAKNIYLDVGIGFGKSHEQCLELSKNLEHFLRFGCPLLYGASRKSIVNAYHPSSVEERLAGTLFLHQKAIENGASIIRAHDSLEHAQLIALHNAYKAL